MLNIHPAIVHFPIGLLTVYSFLEIIRFKKVTNQSYWFYIKAVFVIFGSLGTFAALETGELVGEVETPLLEMHSNFASVATAIYVILAAAYLIRWIKVDAKAWAFLKRPLIAKIWAIKIAVSDFILKTWVSIPLSVIGFVFLTLTGALGGAIAYGPEVDPIVSFVYHLFF